MDCHLPAIRYSFLVFLLLCPGIASASITESDIDELKTNTRFTTWQGIEPDKWATLWLIKRYIRPDAYFVLVPPNTALPANAYAVGLPDSSIRRESRESMFRRLKRAMAIKSPELNYLDALIHDVEVNIWEAPSHPHADWFELMYRELQARYGRDQVPVDCYLAFFDKVSLLSYDPALKAADYMKRLDLETTCPGRKVSDAWIPQQSHLEILREISLGKKVVFIDTREAEEFDEVHLPGAVLLRLRDVNTESVKQFADADLVVPYCVKDFRGFEVARAMKQEGIENVVTLSPNGLKGWLKAHLPVTRRGESSEQQSEIALMRCAMEPLNCTAGRAR
jgi:rhodanese-related sulfurtransferase